MAEPPPTMAILAALCRMKVRVLVQSLTAWRSRWSLALLALVAVLAALAIADAATDFLRLVQGFFLGDVVRWLMALGLVYLLGLVFTSDLIMGHTLNAGQLSTDHVYLASLPIPPLALLGGKLFERLASDWTGVLLLLSGFVGLACRDGFAVGKLVLPVLLFLEVEVLVVLAIILLAFLLQRIARPAAINNFFSLLGYVSVFLALAPHVAIATRPRDALTWIVVNAGAFQGAAGTVLSPARWIIDVLVDGRLDRSFLHWQAFWCISFGAGAGLFLAMWRAHWLTWVHPGIPMRAAGGRAWLSGMLRKEALLLKSDLNLLSNSLFMPVTIIVFEVLIFRGHLSSFAVSHAMNMLGAAAMYFCLFGPINAIGSEGKAIFLLETLPLSPHALIGDKVLFWSLIAETFFLPASLGIGWYLGLPAGSQAALSIWLGIMIPCFIWVSVAMSAIHPRFDGKVLQQRSTLEGKILGALTMGLAVPIKDFSPASVGTALTFGLLAWSIHGKAVECLEGRLDPERHKVPRFRAHDAFLALMVAMGIQGVVRALSHTAYPLADATLWPWLVSYILGMTVLGYTTWRYARDRFPSFRGALGLKPCSLADLGLGVAGAAALAGLGRWYVGALERAGFDVFGPPGEMWEASVTLAGPQWSLGLLVFSACVVAPLVEEAFFRGFVDQAWRDLGWTGLGGILANGVFFAIQHPPLSMPMTFLLGVVCAQLFRASRSLWPGIVLHSLYNAAILAIHAGRL